MDKSEKIINIATKRGFFYPTAEIYNAKAGFWTYGHLGNLMKQKFENLWRDFFLNLDDNYFEIQGSSILPKKVFESSGHLDNFNDPLTECKKCHFRFRADELIQDKLKINTEKLTDKKMDELIKKNKLKCYNCNSELEKVRWFNMMFDLKLGVIGDETAYLSPETAQNPYLSFKREFEALRKKIPLGIAMIGKAFRNEISPRHGFFRLREFTQAELQIFFDHSNINKAKNWDAIKDYKLNILLAKNRNTKLVKCSDLKLPKFYVYHLARIQQFYLDILKIPANKFRFRELTKEEKAFYNKYHFDIELDLETLDGFKEVGGLHYRTDHDLGGHQKGSKENLEIFYDEKRFIPHVLELSFGVDRNIWALLDIFFKEEKERSLFKFPNNLIPFEVAVFPLVNKDKLPEISKDVYNLLKYNFKVFYDDSGSIGRRYRRMDEIGCKFCITIDFDSIKNKDVTLRNRDTMHQIRVKISDLKDTLNSVF